MNSSHTRRTFLATSAAALAAAPLLASAEGVAPVRCAVVGTGGRGSDLIRKLVDLAEAKLVAICDDYSPHLKYGAKYAGDGVVTYDSYIEADFAVANIRSDQISLGSTTGEAAVAYIQEKLGGNAKVGMVEYISLAPEPGGQRHHPRAVDVVDGGGVE